MIEAMNEGRIRVETLLANQASNSDIIASARQDKADFESRVQYDKEGKKLNPLKIDGITGNDPKVIAARLHEIEDKARTHGQPVPIGSLYGFEIVVKTDTTVKEGLDFCENRFFVRGAGKLLYNYNNGRLAADPQTACRNFINAFDSIPRLIEKYTQDNADIEKEIPVLKQVVDEAWKKEDEAVSRVHLMKNLATTLHIYGSCQVFYFKSHQCILSMFFIKMYIEP